MFIWDLTRTPVAQANEPICPPTEAELNLLLNALLMVEGMPYSHLERRTLVLGEENREHVAQVIEWCLSPLSGDMGQGVSLRRRLGQLDGLRVGPVDLKSCSPGEQGAPKNLPSRC